MDAGYIIPGVPYIIWEIGQGSVGENVVEKQVLEGENSW